MAALRRTRIRYRRLLTTSLALLWLCGLTSAQVPLKWRKVLPPGVQSSGGFGRTMCAADMDEDGFCDLVVFEPGAGVMGVPQAGRGWILYGPSLTKTRIFESRSPAPHERMGDISTFGGAGCSLGDVNGDGLLDILVGAPSYSSPASMDVGRAHLFLSPYFIEEVIFDSPDQRDPGRFAQSILLADINSDGLDDVFVGAPEATFFDGGQGLLKNAGLVYRWDGADLGPPIRVENPGLEAQARFGASLDTALIDGDAVPDILIHARSQLPFGASHVFTGHGFSFLKTIGPTPSGLPASVGLVWFGDTIYSGDLNADGIDDLLISAPAAINSFCSLDGDVVLLVGPDYDTVGHLFQSLHGICNTFLFGRSSLVADLNRDGFMDVVIGDAGPTLSDVRVDIFYGPDFATTQVLGDDFGGIVFGYGGELAAGDYDGDGYVELAVSHSGSFGTGGFYLYDLQTLDADVQTISSAQGGDVTFTLDTLGSHPEEEYIALLGMSGSLPGVVLESGVFLPLNVDSLTSVGLHLLNTSVLPNSAGVLDADGRAVFGLHAEPNHLTPLIGLSVTFTALTWNNAGEPSFGANDVTVAVVP